MADALATAGFRLVRCKNHPVWRCPCGHAQIVVAGSGARGRGDKNAYAQIKRTLRGCRPQEVSPAA